MRKKIFHLYRRLLWSPLKYAKYLGVSIGKDCWIATRYFGSEPYLITIGDHVQITGGVRFFTHGGGWILREEQPDFDAFGKIKIGNNVYIGSCSMIMPGVTIGNNIIIGAGSVVTRSVPDGVLLAGNPARIIGTIDDYKQRMQKYNTRSKQLGKREKMTYLLSISENRFIKRPLMDKLEK